MVKTAGRLLEGLERRWMVLNGSPAPLKAYYERAQARSAWQRTLDSYSKRLGVTVADIR
jgi:hypothetical protein